MPALPVSCLRAVLLLVAWMLHVSAEAGSTGYKASFSQRGMVASTKTLTLSEAVAPALGALRHGLTSKRISAERAHHGAPWPCRRIACSHAPAFYRLLSRPCLFGCSHAPAFSALVLRHHHSQS